MAFFLGIGGPWVVLMALDPFWTKQGLERTPPEHRGGLQQRLEHLLQRRDRISPAARARSLLQQREPDEGTPPLPESYALPSPGNDTAKAAL